MASHFMHTSFGLVMPRAAGILVLAAAKAWDAIEGDGFHESALDFVSHAERVELARIVEARDSTDDAIFESLSGILREINDENFKLGIQLSWERDGANEYLWGRSDQGGDLEMVVRIVQESMRRYGIESVYTIKYAHTCSRPMLNMFEGGGVAFDATRTEWIQIGPLLDAAAERLSEPRPASLPSPGA